MKKMDVLIFFVFVTHVLLIFGKVVIMNDMTSINHEITFICVSENDGGALVWNRLTSIVEDKYDYYEINGLQKSNIMCKMNENKGCLESWSKRDWKLTNSLVTPMGPVFDQRWEEFPQYESYNEIKFLGVLRRTNFNEVKLSFSVRTVYNMMILICNGKNVYKDSCYWIVINGWNYTQSVIEKCATEGHGFNKSKDYFDIYSECYFDALVSNKVINDIVFMLLKSI